MLSYCYVGQILIFSKFTNLEITDNLHQSLNTEYLSPQSFPKLCMQSNTEMQPPLELITAAHHAIQCDSNKENYHNKPLGFW